MTAKSDVLRKKSGSSSLWGRFKHYFIDDTILGGNPIVQQTMPGWYAYVSLKWIFPLYFLLTIIFLALGTLMIAKSLHERHTIRAVYSDIHKYQYIPDDPAVNINEGIRSFEVNGETYTQGTITQVYFTLKKRLTSPVYLYYGLEKVYQNFRTFNDGRSIEQLRGLPQSKWKNLEKCEPFRRPGFLDDNVDLVINYTSSGGTSSSTTANSFTYNPCGSYAWSMFNDTFTLYKTHASQEATSGDTGLTLICNSSDFDAVGNSLGGSKQKNRCRKKGITFRADSQVRYSPLVLGDNIWSLRYPSTTTNEYLKNGWYLNEPGHSLQDPEDYDLQVWLRTALLSNFKKLYRIIDEDLEPGDYMMEIEEFYDVVSFKGKKLFYVQNTGPLGNGTRAIAILFFAMGLISFIVGVAFGVEACCKKTELFPNMMEPKRHWYVYDPTAPEFERYNALRITKYVPVVELQALREKQTAK